MNLNFSHTELVHILDGAAKQMHDGRIATVYYDTRLIHQTEEAVFFALEGRKDGHTFVQKAYDKGIRSFVVSKAVSLPADATIIEVKDTLRAIQQLAKHHRNQFSYPVLAITGSLGKTTIKEWLYFLLSDDYTVIRSPRSFNSQLGVAISLLEMDEKHDFAIIEADISHPNEMEFIEDMVSPTIGIYTGIGKYYADNFESQEQHASEHLKLFKHTNVTFALAKHKSELRRNKIAFDLVENGQWDDVNLSQFSYPENRRLALHVAQYLGVDRNILLKKVTQLPSLSNRMEVFEGIDNNLIINDSYNIDMDALEQALSYQFSSNERTDKVVVLDFSFVSEARKHAILEIVQGYHPKKTFIIEENKIPKELLEIKNASILFKGSYRSNLKDIVLLFKNRKHETWVEFDLKAIQNNLRTFQSKLPKNTKTLAMVKASSYGAGDINIPHFLQQAGIDYLGVAYADEGRLLRENGITLPILVLNTEGDAFDDIVQHQLEPTIYSFTQLEQLCNYLEKEKITDFPVHVTFETGMNRLGFNPEEASQVVEILKSKPEISVKGVYSHLADADNSDETYTLHQIDIFKKIKAIFEQAYTHQILFHILNSEGISKFGNSAAFDMVRLGIGLYGYTSTAEKDELLPSVRWMTTISQIREVKAGETVGYSRTYQATQTMRVATIRVGYADGFRRILSNGVGVVYIHGQACPVVGNVCMDMTMVDVTHVDCIIGDEVELLGKHISMQTFAQKLGTIPYEVMTGISKRVSRIYLR
ncbi:MAG: alanine racemase [Brumimicrobium sp.]|nr:alanine racemase [Brumimicrobium sp.]